ncbi:MAG: sigma 54-interacting transcriptional regulator [Microthrixaceae bacterium]
MEQPTVATLGELRTTGWESEPVKSEIRRNVVAKLQSGEPLFPEVLGYEDTVFPQLQNALLAGHDIVFLGERGQAKTRIVRSLVGLLDEWMPIIAGSEINDDPYHPVSAHARNLVAEMGEDTPIDWVHRDARFGEKLATPDTSVADLIGEVDPIKVAEGRYLSDELTLHYGLVPRTNRGIFAMNELPDLAERIQVGLLNVLEERDVQIRGYKLRLPLDVLLVASANPEDYTNRGRSDHTAQGPLRVPGTHALPPRRRDRTGDHPSGGKALLGAGDGGRGARVHGRHHRHDLAVGASEPTHLTAFGCVGPPLGFELRGDGRQRSAPGSWSWRDGRRATDL